MRQKNHTTIDSITISLHLCPSRLYELYAPLLRASKSAPLKRHQTQQSNPAEG
jgi:hypothetical protein